MSLQNNILDLEFRINDFPKKVRRISTEQLEYKPTALKWSKKEIIGHLIDSAFNNLQRFIRVQHENVPHITYAQNEWVKAQNWQNLEVETILNLWRMINNQIIAIWKNFPQDKLQSKIDVSKDKKEVYSFTFLADDYIKHFDHHASKILEV